VRCHQYLPRQVRNTVREGRGAPAPAAPPVDWAREVEAATQALHARGTVGAAQQPLFQARLDDDEGQEIFFSIKAGNDDGFFRINKCSGQLYVAKTGLDYKVRQQYMLTNSK